MTADVSTYVLEMSDQGRALPLIRGRLAAVHVRAAVPATVAHVLRPVVVAVCVAAAAAECVAAAVAAVAEVAVADNRSTIILQYCLIHNFLQL